MSQFTPLTNGCLADIMIGIEIEKPVLQILGHKRISSSEGSERFRILISDGKYSHSFAMLASQLNEIITKGELMDNTIIQLNKYITSTVNKSEKGDKKILIMLDIEILHKGDNVGSRIGTPVSVPEKCPQTQATGQSTMSASNAIPSTSRNNATNGNTQNGDTTLGAENLLTHPISSLSPYQNKWVIKARVTSKSSIRTWKNAKGEGKLFSMDLMDDSGEIRVTGFKDQCDRFFDMIEVGKVYYISKCQLKPANKQYTAIKNDYEMTMGNDTTIQECQDAIDDTPDIQYNFVPIAQIANIEANSIIDVLGVCKETGEVQEFVARSSGRELRKREVTLVDTSNASIGLTLWGNDALNFDGYTQPVMLLKGTKVGEFGGGKTLNLIGGSTMKMNPDIPEGHKLRGWFDNGGSERVQSSVSARTGAGVGGPDADWMTFYETTLRNLGSGDRPDYFQCKAAVHMVKTQSPFYKACSQPDCNKKVIDGGNGVYMCEKCNIEGQTFKYRLLLNMSIADWTSNRWVTCFSDLAEKMLGKSAQELGELYENDKEAANAELGSINFKYFTFKLRSKAESFGDSLRNKITIISATPVNYKEYNKHLVNGIQDMTGVRRNE